MEKKYEVVKEDSINYNGHILYRIKALKDFDDVKKGDLGGYIEKELNLYQEGNCWVYNNAKVYDDAVVFGNAKIFDDAEVSGSTITYEDAEVYGNAVVYGNASIFGNAKIYDNAEVSGDAKVYGNAKIYDNAEVSGDSSVYRNAVVYGHACIFGNAKIYDNAEVSGDAKVYGNAKISGNQSINCGNYDNTESELNSDSNNKEIKKDNNNSYFKDEHLKEICIKNNWIRDNEKYEKIFKFNNNKNTYSLNDLAFIIWCRSDDSKLSSLEIYNILKKECFDIMKILSEEYFNNKTFNFIEDDTLESFDVYIKPNITCTVTRDKSNGCITINGFEFSND